MGNAMTKPLKAFLCHASGDKPAVREMYKRLVFEGVDAWLDKEKLLPGQDWRVEIPNAVQDADVVIVFLSKKSVSKEGYVQKEIKFALDIAEEKPEGTIFLIPARLEECLVPERLSRWQWVDLFEDNGFVQLLRSLKLRARAVGASVEPTSYEDLDRETAQRVDQLYTEGLAAFYTEDWDRACQRFRTILSEQPGHKSAAEKLAEADKQRNLTRLYVRAEREYQAENWAAAAQFLEDLLGQSSEYKDTAQLLKNAKKKKRLGELYIEAKALHMAQKWQAVTKVFEQMAAIDPACPDPDHLLPSAQKEVAELKRIADLNEQYSLAVRRMDAGEWLEARSLLEKVHKSQTGFQETERLLRKAEDEIMKVEDQNRRRDQVNLFYEQAHGLIRSKNWRKALDKVEEIQQLDSQFEDRDGITAQAKTELAREEQEAQRQNELAAMYAKAVRLLQEGQYQDALNTWEEVKAIDSKYPDRQWVQRTAKKKLAEMTKPVKPKDATKKFIWMGTAVFLLVAVIVVGVALLLNLGQQMLSSSTPSPMQTTVPFFTSTKVPAKTSTTRPATSTPFTGGYDDPTMYDDFNDPTYDGKINSIKWIYGGVGYFSQGNGMLMLRVNGTKNEISIYSHKQYSLEAKPIFVESRIMSDPNNVDVGGGLQLISNNGESNCTISTGQGYQSVRCWSISFGVEQQDYSVEISPGTWHILKIELFPDTMTFKYLVDGNVLGSYTPENKQDFKSSVFNAGLWMNNWGDATEYPVGYMDYVRMGAIEDDLTNQEPFSRAVGEWEAADWSDGSHMTMSVNRVSAGRYTFALADDSAGFCGGSSGKAEFQSDTLSNTATGTFEFVCDSSGNSGNFEYKFTYNSVDDQFVDYDGVIWERKK